MKTLFYVLILSMLTANAKAQLTPVTNLSGTTAGYGTGTCTTNVAVLGAGPGAATGAGCGGTGPYWIGIGSVTGSYTYTFSSPVRRVVIRTEAQHSGEVINISINGNPVLLTNVNMTAGVGCAGGADVWPAGYAAFPVGGGPLTSTSGASNGASATITIDQCGIDNLEIQTPGAVNGSYISLSIVPEGPHEANLIPPFTLCIGGTRLVNAGSTPGGTYGSTNPSVATVSPAGVVTGHSAGTATITYAVTTPCACSPGTASTTVTVEQPAISGPAHVCSLATTLWTAVPGGGSWVSGSTGVATITPSGTPATVTGGSVGSTIITYTSPTGCVATAPIFVDPLPTISVADVCAGATVIASVTSGPGGGTWTSSAFTTASVPLGPSGSAAIVSGVSAGSAFITYTTPAGCQDVRPINVDPLPLAFNVIGGGFYCPGGTGVNIDLDNSEPGVEYQLFCGTTPIGAPVPGSGTGITFGLQTTIGCYTVIARYTLTPTHCTNTMSGTVCVSLHTAPAITWPGLCSGSIVPRNPFPPLPPGGFAIGTMTTPGTSINPVTGEITCGADGPIDIVYTDPVTTCVWLYHETIRPTPVLVLGINPSPSDVICVGQSTNISLDMVLSFLPPGTALLWTSLNPGIATVTGSTTPFETITGVSPGTTVITCTATTPFGCIGIVNFTIIVNPLPVVTITSFPAATIGPPLTVLECDGAELTAHSSVPSTYVWTPTTAMVPVGGTTPVVTVTPPAVTVYTITVTDIATGCSNWADITVIPVTNPCVCDALHSTTTVIPVAPFGLTGTITTPPPAGNYYMANNVTISGSGTITLSNCVIFIGAGWNMFVDPSTKLVLDHCHLFCCEPDMWKGIELQNGGPSSGLQGQIELINGTMIEDAMIAISVPSPETPAPYAPGIGGQLIINSTDAIFNKNVIGIRVSNYHNTMAPFPAVASGAGYGYPVHQNACYPFVIENTVFTSRKFDNYSTVSGGGGFPVQWPWNWPTTANLKAPWTPLTHNPPFNIDNNINPCPNGRYQRWPCNFPVGTPPVFADRGIDLENVGYVTPGLTPGSEIYSSFVSGTVPPAGSNTELNMFDNLRFGIYAKNSDAVVRNSVFMYMNGTNIAPSYGGVGVYAINTNPPGVDNRYKLYVYGSNGTGLLGTGGVLPTGNDFYGCFNGVETWEYYHVKAEFTRMFNRLHTPAKGLNGFSMVSSNYYDVQLNYNEIVNFSTGINYAASIPVVSPLYGQISIKNNKVSPNNFSVPTSGQYVKQGISVFNASAGLGAATVPGSQVNIDNNIMDHVLNGIRVENFWYQVQPVTINDNTLGVERSTLPPSAGITKQTGIRIMQVNPGFVEGNVITGPGYTNPMPPSYSGASYTSNMIEGIRIENLSGHIVPIGPEATVGCNTVSDINTGFYFETTSSSFDWVNNTMNQNAYGMVLNGDITPQLGPGQICYNQWLPAGTGFWTGGNYQTYTMGTTDPTISPLHVTNNAAENPVNNGTEAPAIAPYSTGGLSIVITTSLPPICPTIPPSTVAYRHSNGDTIDKVKPAVTNVEGGQSYMLYPNPSDGNITLQQSLADVKPVSATILNATGQQVYKGDFHFENGTTQFNMINKVPGLYLLQLTDSKGERFTVKFIIK